MKTIRILHVVGTMDFGGVETLLMTIYRKIDRNIIQFDFLCHNTIDSKFSNEIIQLGGKMYCVMGPRHVGMVKYIEELYHFFMTHPEYQIVHAHKSDYNGLILSQAKRAGVSHRISHSHIADCEHSFPASILAKYSRFLNNKSLTERLACSIDAGNYLYGKGKNFRIIPNAIDIAHFTFDEERRKKNRHEMGIADDFLLVGHVGRFCDQKNQRFLLDIFSEYHKINSKSILLLLGGGEDEDKIRKKVAELDLNDFVILGGLHNDLAGFYAAMDVFLFPSKYEGLGIVAVEAQCCGLPVIASEMVPMEAKVIDRMKFLPLTAPLDQWVEEIEQARSLSTDRLKCADNVSKSMFNIDAMAENLQKYYIELGRRT